MGEIPMKVQELRMNWYGHVMRREEHYVGRNAMEMKVQGRKKRWRRKRRWLERVRDDIKENGLLVMKCTNTAQPSTLRICVNRGNRNTQARLQVDLFWIMRRFRTVAAFKSNQIKSSFI